MAKFTFFLLCIVGASLSKVYAASDAEKADFHRAIVPIIGECAVEYQISREEIEAAVNEHNADALNPCAIACVLKNTGVIDTNGFYDAKTSLARIRPFVKNDEEFAKLENAAQECLKVNDEPVNDGAMGCERAKLVLACTFKNRSEMPF